MRVYMDTNRNEIVSEDVAHARMRASIEDEDIMNYIFNHVSWDELREHIDENFVFDVIDELSNDWFDESFEGYDLIESESEQSDSFFMRPL